MHERYFSFHFPYFRDTILYYVCIVIVFYYSIRYAFYLYFICLIAIFNFYFNRDTYTKYCVRVVVVIINFLFCFIRDMFTLEIADGFLYIILQRGDDVKRRQISNGASDGKKHTVAVTFRPWGGGIMVNL